MGRTRRSAAGSLEFDDMYELMRELLLRAVAETVESGSPEPARNRMARILEIDDEVAEFAPGPPPAQTVVLVILTRWLARAAREGIPAPDSDEVLDWIAQHLGPRYRARARYMIGMLDPETAREAVGYVDALGDDFLPTLIWIATALAALHGEGDPAWLTDELASRR